MVGGEYQNHEKTNPRNHKDVMDRKPIYLQKYLPPEKQSDARLYTLRILRIQSPCQMMIGDDWGV